MISALIGAATAAAPSITAADFALATTSAVVAAFGAIATLTVPAIAEPTSSTAMSWQSNML